MNNQNYIQQRSFESIREESDRVIGAALGGACLGGSLWGGQVLYWVDYSAQ